MRPAAVGVSRAPRAEPIASIRALRVPAVVCVLRLPVPGAAAADLLCAFPRDLSVIYTARGTRPIRHEALYASRFAIG